MYGGVGGRINLALVLGLGLSHSGSPASAADLGGDCCADLEERIAELEATTARKGNRKVSLEVSGQVNEAVLFWDDGAESNAYVVTNDNSRTRFRFKGKAKIDTDWEAGYLIEVGVRTANSKRFTQETRRATIAADDVGFDLRDSYWYLKSKTYGSGSLGQQATATDADHRDQPDADQGLLEVLGRRGYGSRPALASGRSLGQHRGPRPATPHLAPSHRRRRRPARRG